MCIKCHFHWTCSLPSTHILYIFRKIYLDFFQKEIPNPNILKFVLKWGYTNTKYYQIYGGVSDTNTNSTKYTLETPNNPKYKYFMVIWKTKCQALIWSLSDIPDSQKNWSNRHFQGPMNQIFDSSYLFRLWIKASFVFMRILPNSRSKTALWNIVEMGNIRSSWSMA